MPQLNNIAVVMPDPSTYDIRINEFQRAMLQKCINYTLHNMPSGMWKSPDEAAVASNMLDMIKPDSNNSVPLWTDGINSFVL